MTSYRPVNAVLRGLDVLATINRLGGQATVGEIYQQTGIDKATIVRMLETLAHAGFIVRHEERRVYEVTAKSLLLSSGYEKARSIGTIVSPILSKFRDDIGWPSDIGLCDSDAVVLIETSREAGPLFFNRYPGYRVPILATSLGLTYVAFCDPDEREAILKRAAKDPAPWNDIARDSKLANVTFARIRKQGYALMHPAYSEQQYNNKIGSIGMPIIKNDTVFASINVIFLKKAVSKKDAVQQLLPSLSKTSKKMAEEIATRWAR